LLPTQYLLLFVALLREIGMQEILTNSYAREFLLDIKKACSYQRLNPNELHAAMEILNQSTSDGSEGWYDAVIADDGCRLVSAASCVYVDPPLPGLRWRPLRGLHGTLADGCDRERGIEPSQIMRAMKAKSLDSASIARFYQSCSAWPSL
jgi:hypothetical protein